MLRLSALALILGIILPWTASAQQADPYTFCAFYPQGAPCEALYQRALNENAPQALAVREAYARYGRYLKMPAATLIDQDRQFLSANSIALPADLGAADLGGLHNVIADPALKDGAARLQAVNNFLSRAIEAQLFCGLGSACSDAAQTAKPSGT